MALLGSIRSKLPLSHSGKLRHSMGKNHPWSLYRVLYSCSKVAGQLVQTLPHDRTHHHRVYLFCVSQQAILRGMCPRRVPFAETLTKPKGNSGCKCQLLSLTHMLRVLGAHPKFKCPNKKPEPPLSSNHNRNPRPDVQ